MNVGPNTWFCDQLGNQMAVSAQGYYTAGHKNCNITIKIACKEWSDKRQIHMKGRSWNMQINSTSEHLNDAGGRNDIWTEAVYNRKLVVVMKWISHSKNAL